MKKVTALVAALTVAASLTACSENRSPAESIPGDSSASQNSSNSESPDQSSEAQSSSQSSSDWSGSTSAHSEVTLIKDGLPEFKPLYATDGLNYKTLLGIPNSDGSAAVYSTETGAAIWLSDHPNYHYIWVDADGNELDLAGFNFVDK